VQNSISSSSIERPASYAFFQSQTREQQKEMREEMERQKEEQRQAREQQKEEQRAEWERQSQDVQRRRQVLNSAVKQTESLKKEFPLRFRN
jgi:dipeptidase